ncbi:prephenate dehydratase [Suttonella ornithocola]|uniref:Bifunctional chorismate mutase/prephenate dehydratase n=1 Tax=Suttonella ornithocola TaxID=279832 RepID=A0A380MRI1_9GAMM|nr:prephenate dehydratase [Suttonella ornithocola]SUO94764.1 P-protein [Suttonella ornithocola]
MKSLAELRQQIDTLDAEILTKLSERARCAQQVGEVKKAESGHTNIVFYRPERERQVLERLKSLNQGPLPDNEVARLFREIMSACLALELPLNIAYLGPEGTFTQAAALKQFGHSVDTQPMRSIADVFKAVETGECQYGIVPVENSTEGMVTHTLDTLALSPLNICGEVQLKIAQNLLSKATQLSDIQTIYSHSQSLAQCRRWIAEHLPHVELIVVASNAEAAKRAAQDTNTAAIAGKMAADLYDIPVRYSHIEDDSNNTTRFLVIGNQYIDASGSDKTSILVSAHNRPGLLYKLLEPIERHGVNMTRIESRPSRRGMWEYIFFIDLEGHQSQPEMQTLFAEIRQTASLFRVLGSYPKAAE